MQENIGRNVVTECKSDISPVMIRDLLASGSRKLFTESPPLLAPAIIILSDKV